MFFFQYIQDFFNKKTNFLGVLLYVGIYKTTEQKEYFGEIPITVLLRFMLYCRYVPFINYLRSQFESDSDMFLYLINKYIKRLKALTHYKKSSKKIYQPNCKEYQNTTMRVELKIHQILSDVSFSTGYSISFLIRIMIEWEIDSAQLNIHNQTPNSHTNQLLSLTTVVTKIHISHIYEVVSEVVYEIFDFSLG